MDDKGGSAIEIFTVAVDTLSPNPPTNVTATTPIMPEMASISWTVSDSHDVAYQRLEVNATGTWVSVRTFTGNTVNSHNYIMSTNNVSFRVIAIDNVGNEAISDSFNLSI